MNRIERVIDAMFSDRGRALMKIYVFGAMGILSIVGIFFNAAQIVTAALCAIVVKMSTDDLKKLEK